MARQQRRIAPSPRPAAAPSPRPASLPPVDAGDLAQALRIVAERLGRPLPRPAAAPSPRPASLPPVDAGDLAQALRIVAERLGRPLTPQEQSDVAAVVAAGATPQQLRTAPTGRGDASEGLFPTLVGTRRVVSSTSASPSTGGGAPGAFQPPGGLGSPAGGDPFGLGLAGETTFIKRETRRFRTPDLAGRGAPFEIPRVDRLEMTVNELFSEFVKWGPGKVAYWQDRFRASGFLRGPFQRGWADEATLRAAGEAIQAAQGRGIALPDLLAKAETVVSQYPPARAAFVAPDREKPDPATIREGVRALYRQEFGRAPKAAELDRLARLVQRWDDQGYAQRVAAARAQYDAEGAAARDVTGRTPAQPTVVTQGIDPSARLSETLQADPEALAHFGGTTVFDSLLRLIQGTPS